MTALLALASAGLIGGADFLGGLTSRRANGIRVAALVQVAGLIFAVPISIAYGADAVSSSDVAWSLMSGIAVGAGLGCFYLAMGRGLISVVAPVAAVTGAVIPVVYALVRGERPGTTAAIGLAIALFAVAVVSMAPADQHPDSAGALDRTVIALSVASGVLFGTFYIMFSLISDDAGLLPVTLERIGSSIILVALAFALTRGLVSDARRLLPAVLVIAALEVAASVPLLIALQRGPVAIASVLASLYPVTTVILAGVILRERLSRLQYVGVACALVAVVLISSG